MMSTDAEYRRAIQRLAEDAETLGRQRSSLDRAGLTGRELDRAMGPLMSFRAGHRAGLEEEVEVYTVARGAAGDPLA